jgi:hypothetical protein
MSRTIIGLVAAGAMAAGVATVPTQAHAVAPWVVPAIVAAGVIGGVVGAAAAQNNRIVVPNAPGFDRDAYCHAKYRSYNSLTGTYTTYSGQQRLCVVP